MHKKLSHSKGFGLIGIILFISLLSIIFLMAFFSSKDGWGYPGHNNNYVGGTSFFYFGAPNMYRDRSIRDSSINGPGHRGGGISGGK